MRNTFLGALASGVLLIGGTTARADSFYNFSFGAPAYSGNTATVNLFIEDDASSFIQTEDGLQSAGFLVSRSSGNASIQSFTPAPAFDIVTENTVSGNSANVWLQSFGGAPVVSSHVLLGTLLFQLGSSASSFDVNDRDPTLSENVTFKLDAPGGGGFVLDEFQFGQPHTIANDADGDGVLRALVPAGLDLNAASGGPVVPLPTAWAGTTMCLLACGVGTLLRRR